MRQFTHLDGASPPLLGVLPGLMWIFVVVAFVRAVLTSDEFQQRIHMQAVSLAGVLAIVLLLVVSGLQRAGIYEVGQDHLTGNATSEQLAQLIGSAAIAPVPAVSAR